MPINHEPTGEIEHRVPTITKGLQELARVGSQIDWPLPRPSWREEVEQSYEAYQNDVSARVARQVDVTMVIRYFDMQELIARVFDELIILDTFTVTNAAGTSVTHPHLAAFARLSGAAIKLANEIGATPMARMKLGLYATEGAAAQAALERAVNADRGVRENTSAGVEIVIENDETVVMSW